jgi:hypothetical protein
MDETRSPKEISKSVLYGRQTLCCSFLMPQLTKGDKKRISMTFFTKYLFS